MPNTEKWYNQGEFTEYLNCEISDFKIGRCSDEIEVPEYCIEVILAHHRELIVKEMEEKLWIFCCYTFGMHDLVHFQNKKYICGDQV